MHYHKIAVALPLGIALWCSAGAARALSSKTFPGCPGRPLSCNQSVAGVIDPSDCYYQDTGRYVELWEFFGVAGQTVSIAEASDDLDPYVVLYDPQNRLVAYDDDSGPGLDAQLSHVLTQTGTWQIGAATYRGYVYGAYSLALSCSGSTACAADHDTLCLSGGRFKVEARYATPGAGSGTAQAVPLTSDTGYLWFFNAANVEVVIKVLDGCGVNGRYWVFAGGLTDVHVEISVTDTTTGAVKRYTNPQSTVWRTITDSGAFATCP